MSVHNMKAIDARLNNLKKSPLFKLSLSSNELFHSNFIQWLLDHPNVKIATQAQASFCAFLDVQELKIIDPLREKKHKDLVLTLVDSAGNELRKVIIEIKVKSWRDLDQLGKYYEQEKKNEVQPLLVLLSMTAPPEAKDGECFNNKKGGSWRYLSFKRLGTSFIRPLSFFASREGDTYLASLLDDYASMIEDMTQLLEYDLFPRGTREKALGKLTPARIKRLSDKLQESCKLNAIYEKRLFEHFGAIVAESMKKKTAGTSISFSTGKEDKDVPLGSINISSGYSDSGQKGFITLSYRHTANDIVIGVQIEGSQYRHFISHVAEGTSVEHYVESYFDSYHVGAGTNTPRWKLKSGKKLNVPANNSKYEKYCSFKDKHFLYLHTSIKDRPMSEILEVAVEDILWQARRASFLQFRNTTLTPRKTPGS